MPHDEILAIQTKLLKTLMPEVWTDSIFLSSKPEGHINAFKVFDAIRNLSDPPMPPEAFNQLADQIESTELS